MSEFPFERLRRWPDVEATNLFAVDASDRLILDEAAVWLAEAGPGEVVVLEDHYGALTLAAAALLSGRPDVRVNQDALSGERALDHNAADLEGTVAGLAGLTGAYRHLPLGAELFAGARLVLMQLPRSLAALDELAGAIARFAAGDVTVVAGGRVKHMSVAMNAVLLRHFGDLNVTPARQKSRVLIATQPKVSGGSSWPRAVEHADLGLTVCAHGAAFAGTTIDIGTRYLLEFQGRMKPDATTAIDLGCGTGVLAAALARRRPGLQLLATDQSAAAVASAAATMTANGVADRVQVLRDDALSAQPDASAELIMLNPPFHIGSSVHAGIALKLFEDAARVLRPGGELWAVWNTHLGYRPALTRIVGPTHQVGRNTKFTVTVSTRR
ncbi:methyltransferase domain-containing protein [Cryobacterium lactosi]|uniref:Methyltransferase domain-containing protein n=1 Tax=Cryobacterium lactosi TaxID=1259202 RepID=A0A4R9BYG8_9MICO|nr:methyltransferase [Cryobacterium lactosi]TFD93327.1 methyltransferase domain-containing protein [Cryobacterium lactosi]